MRTLYKILNGGNYFMKLSQRKENVGENFIRNIDEYLCIFKSGLPYLYISVSVAPSIYFYKYIYIRGFSCLYNSIIFVV